MAFQPQLPGEQQRASRTAMRGFRGPARDWRPVGIISWMMCVSHVIKRRGLAITQPSRAHWKNGHPAMQPIGVQNLLAAQPIRRRFQGNLQVALIGARLAMRRPMRVPFQEKLQEVQPMRAQFSGQSAVRQKIAQFQEELLPMKAW